MMKSVSIRLEDIYVPMKLRRELDAAKIEALAESIIDKGLQTPIQVRRDRERYVLVTGLHRLEAVRVLGEAEIEAFIVSARQH
jgi:ParB-like chromosome segregation protein Spo0J